MNITNMRASAKEYLGGETPMFDVSAGFLVGSIGLISSEEGGAGTTLSIGIPKIGKKSMPSSPYGFKTGQNDPKASLAPFKDAPPAKTQYDSFLEWNANRETYRSLFTPTIPIK
ncbi:hypothetical protein EHQ47_04935 [Leptospira bourretii]|uniref:hypothetical protein n=1 Tax=Leptospira bourretii TaxID=2484962 RepID=UPI0010915EF8|nr:hypothetical protein [Leptospira bourretii]TGL25281.1 hypothetical protein EHQ47_04935 [Leptospira bourretii]